MQLQKLELPNFSEVEQEENSIAEVLNSIAVALNGTIQAMEVDESIASYIRVVAQDIQKVVLRIEAEDSKQKETIKELRKVLKQMSDFINNAVEALNTLAEENSELKVKIKQ
jgi:SMC interacting uncharacterized protein involved in chromosome segregation